MKKYRESMSTCMYLLVALICMSAVVVSAQDFDPIGTVTVTPGETTIVQIENFTPASDENRGYVLELDADALGIVLRSLVDGRVDEFPLTDEVQLTIDVTQADTYYLFAQTKQLDGSSDSFFVGIDGNIGNSDDYRFNTPGAAGVWERGFVTSESTGNEVVAFELSAGQHVINWHMREPNSRVDWVGITTDPNLNLAQVEAPGGDSAIITAERVVDNLVVEGGEDVNVTITATNATDIEGTVDVVENLPADWSASNISGGGTESDGAITWSVTLGANASQELSYTATAPANLVGDQAVFAGFVSNEIGDIDIAGSDFVVVSQDIGIFEGSADIGDVDVPGSAEFDGSDTYLVRGSGADIWNNADEFHFLFMEMDGSFSIEVDDIFNLPVESSSDWVKTGLMVRDSFASGAINFMVQLRTDFQANTQWRSALNAGSSSTGVTNDYELPLQLIRIGDSVQAIWTNPATGDREVQSSQILDFTGPVLVGLAVTSHEDGSISEGEFTGITITQIDFNGASRSLSNEEFSSGETLTVTITVDLPESGSANFELTENVPAGWAVSNINASAGNASEADSVITWSASGATGDQNLSYEVTPVDEDNVGNFSGTIESGGFSAPITGPSTVLRSGVLSVYFVYGDNLDEPENKILLDLLTDGLTLLDENNQEKVIPGLGYFVVPVNEDNDNPSDALAFDLVMTIETLSSGNAAQYIDLPVAYMSTEQVLIAGRSDRPGSLFFGPESGVATPNGDFEFEIAAEHPITALWNVGDIIEVSLADGQLAGMAIDDLAPAAQGLAITGLVSDPLRYALIVADEGATGFTGAPLPPGAEPAPARRGYIGYHENVINYVDDDPAVDNVAITEDGAIIFQRLVQWLVGAPVTADGTETGTPVVEWSLY